MAIRLRTRRCTSSRTASPGSETSSMARASGRDRGHELGRLREDLLQPPARDVGEGQQAQRLARRGAVDDHAAEAPVLVVALDLQQAEELVEAGRNRELLGADAVHAALEQQLAQPVLHRGPVALHLVLRRHLLGPQALADLRRLAAHRGSPASRRASAPDRSTGSRCRPRSPRRAAPWQRRPRSCRPRPCPCRGSSGAPWRRVSLLSVPAPRCARPRRRRCPPGRPRAGAPPAHRGCAGGRRRRGGRSRSAPSA